MTPWYKLIIKDNFNNEYNNNEYNNNIEYNNNEYNNKNVIIL